MFMVRTSCPPCDRPAHALPALSSAIRRHDGAGQNSIRLLARCAKINPAVAQRSFERLDLLPLSAGEAERIQLLVLELGHELLRLARAGERAGNRPVGLPPG